MKFVIVVERAFHQAIVIGPFDHREDAETYGKDRVTGNIWRVVVLETPKT